jgi:hypothetical protein
LHKRSKQKWLLQGDKQYRIFPQIYQCEKKKEYDLPDGEGRQYTLQKEEDILEHATEYYKTLFGPSEKNPYLIWTQTAGSMRKRLLKRKMKPSPNLLV